MLSHKTLGSCSAVVMLCSCYEGATSFEPELIAPSAVSYRQSQPAPIDDENQLSAYVAQCESVLGPIPEIHCDYNDPAPGTHVTRVPVFEGGHLLGFGSDLSEQDLARLTEREQAGYECDFPSLGGDFPCSIGTTLVQYSSDDNPNVQWMGLCRGAKEDIPEYNRFIGNGLIGANSKTGEMCFFFGSNPDPEQPYELPALSSEKTDEELAPWLPPREMPGSCISCHPNNDPWVLTPWLMPEYMRSVLESPSYPLDLPEGVELDEVMAARYVELTPSALRTQLPTVLPANRRAWTEEEIIDEDGDVVHRQYRIVGSSYVDSESKGLVKPRQGIDQPESWSVPLRERIRAQDPSDSCAAGCHAVANEYFVSLAMDSRGEHKIGDRYLSDFMRSEDAAGFEWMPPYRELLDDPPEVPPVDLEQFTAEGITECPIPKQLVEPPTLEIICDGGDEFEGLIELSWDYLNDYGEVPGRSDIRFEVAYGSEAAQPLDQGVSARSELEGVAMEPEPPYRHVLHDVAPDHGRRYSVRVPFNIEQQRVVVDLQPKRFCFEEPDRNPFAYAPPHRVSIDVTSTCG